METHHFLPLSQASRASFSQSCGSCLCQLNRIEHCITVSTKKVDFPGGTQSLGLWLVFLLLFGLGFFSVA